MNIKRITEIEADIDEAVQYYRAKYTRGPFWGNWAVDGSSNVPYAVNYYPDGSFDCSCPAYLHSPRPHKTCKHTRILKLMVRIGEVIVPEDRIRKPLLLGNIHYQILKWFKSNNIDNPMNAVTTRMMISKMRSRECLHADQTFRGRTSELFKAGLLSIIEPVTELDNAPPSSHYFLSKRGQEAIS